MPTETDAVDPHLWLEEVQGERALAWVHARNAGARAVLQQHPRFSAYLTDAQIDLLFKSAPLHDIGKVGIPDRILLKPGRLDADEMEIMKTHTTLGREAIEHAEKSLDVKVEFLALAKEIAYRASGSAETRAADADPNRRIAEAPPEKVSKWAALINHKLASMAPPASATPRPF
jgi:hypothetical protein